MHFTRQRFRFSIVSLEFVIDIILPAAQCPWDDLDSNSNEYHGGEGGRAYG